MRIIRVLITLCMMWQIVVGNDYYYTMDLPVYWGNAPTLSLTCNNSFSTNYTHSPSVASSRPLFMPTHADVDSINLYGTQQLMVIQKQQTNLLNKVKYLSSQEVAHAISKAPVINVFKAHFLYSLPTYLAQIKELPGWTAYILALEQEIKQNRKKYWHTPGFKVHEKFWGKSTSEFNEKVHELAADARQMQSNETAYLQQVTKKLSKQVKNLTQNPAMKNEWLAKRTVQKIHQDDFHQDQQAFHAGADIPYINEKLQHVETYRDAFEEHEHHELVSYGFAMAQAADTEVMHGSYGGWERAHHRMDATLQTINNPDYTMQSAHNLSKQQLDTYVAGGGNIMQLSSERDTILQNCLHRELISTIDDTTQLELLYGEGLFAGNIYSLVYRCTDAALQHKQDNRITMATNLSDFCHSLYQSCADYAVSLGTTGIGYTKDALELVMRVSSKSCGILGEHARTYLIEAVKHPIKTAADVTLLFTAPSFYLAKTIYSIYQNFDEVKQAADTYRSLCRTNPDDAAALALAYSLEMALTGKALQAASVKFASQLQAVETIVAQTQQEVAYAIAGAKVKVNIPTPLAALGNTTKDLVLLAEKHGVEAVKRAMTKIEQKPFLKQKNVINAVEAEIVHNNNAIKAIDKAIKEGIPVPGPVQSTITIEADGWNHIINRHFSKKNASQFTISQQELSELLVSNTVINSPIIRMVPSQKYDFIFAREITLDKIIGLDKFNNYQPTSTMTVFTSEAGVVVSAFPGKG